MLRFSIPALAITAMVAAVIMMRWPSTVTDIASGTAAMPSLQELHVIAGIHNLSVQEIDDQALVYGARSKH